MDLRYEDVACMCAYDIIYLCFVVCKYKYIYIYMYECMYVTMYTQIYGTLPQDLYFLKMCWYLQRFHVFHRVIQKIIVLSLF